MRSHDSALRLVDLRETPLDVAEVVAALEHGDDVFALFPTSHGMMPMRRFRVVEYDNGWQTVNLDGPPTHEHEIHDMLHVS